MNNSRVLTRADILGARICAVYQTYQTLDGWLDCTHTYFELDREKLIVGTPYPGQPWEPSALPPEAKVLKHALSDSIKNKAIVGVYCDLYEGVADVDPASMKFLLDDGRWVWTNAVAPQGVAFTGLFVDEPSKYSVEQLIEFWLIPLEEP